MGIFADAVFFGLLAYASFANAAISQTCPGSSGICYSLNIPDQTASSGSGDIFFQLKAPTSFQWVGLGQGSGMAGANIFVMYTSANGQNVTVSPRLGVGHVEPEHDGDTAQITLLQGSGVSNGTMTANVRCANCNSWNGGSMDFQGSSGQWIYAAKSGSPLDSDALDEELTEHEEHDSFSWDFTTAKGGNDVNPFLAAASANTTTTTSSSGGYSEPSNITQIMIAHGVLAGLAFVILFPVGGILIRLATFTGVIRFHIAIQLLAWSMFLAAFGMGVYMATSYDLTDNRHPILGIIILGLIFFQPIFGYLHHRLAKKTGLRNVWSFVHLSIGRIAIILGMINGGLGLSLAGNASKGAIIAYGVVAGIFGVSYLAAVVVGEIRRYRKGNAGHGERDGREKGDGSMEQGA